MKQINNYGDERQVSQCIFCWNKTETRDHIPSKIFLDKPYPNNLPVVPACEQCNHSFSLDEEYLACLIECAKNGSIDPMSTKRWKIRNILRKKPRLTERLKQAMSIKGDSISFSVEDARVHNVVLKLAKGHSVYEYNEPKLEAPSSITCTPIHLIDTKCREKFESPILYEKFPEVGCRALQRMAFCDFSPYSSWIEVQPKRYRYLINDGVVRIVINEYLACEISW